MKIKRKILAAAALAALLALSPLLSGCAGEETGNGTGGDDAGASGLRLNPGEYPRVDGSTATIPLSEAFAAVVMDLPVEEARQYILHNTTHQAYENLIDGKKDIIFVTSPSQDELDAAAERGVKLRVVPVVSEGFVFLVSRENPVDGLTLNEIQDIYRGKITNWNQVGGGDQEIAAYQRPVNSGSQTGMYDLVLPADQIMEAPSALQVQSMGELVDVVADYQNGPGAIGYSYYYYVTDMWQNDDIKLLQVDGVYPDGETISDDSYPIHTAYYAVLPESAPEDGPAARLLAWILSEEGQRTAEEAGYVALEK